MRILIATGIFPPDIGGPAEYAKNLAEEFLRRGERVAVLSYRLEKKLPVGIRHFLFFIRMLVHARNADAVIALDTFSVGVPSVCAARLLGKKIVIRIGGDFLWESYVERARNPVPLSQFYKKRIVLSAKEKIIRWITGAMLRRADAVVFSTAWQRDMFIEAYRLDQNRSHIIENFFGEQVPGAEPSRKSFLWAGRRLALKNIGILTEVFSDQEVQSMGASLEIAPKMPHEALFEKIKGCWAVILPSLSEVSPNFILDAIRAGKPFIMTKDSGLHEKLKDVGVFIDPLNKEDIKEKVLLLSKDSRYQEYRRKIQAFHFTHSWGQIADEFLTIFAKV